MEGDVRDSCTLVRINPSKRTVSGWTLNKHGVSAWVFLYLGQQDNGGGEEESKIPPGATLVGPITTMHISWPTMEVWFKLQKFAEIGNHGFPPVPCYGQYGSQAGNGRKWQEMDFRALCVISLLLPIPFYIHSLIHYPLPLSLYISPLTILSLILPLVSIPLPHPSPIPLSLIHVSIPLFLLPYLPSLLSPIPCIHPPPFPFSLFPITSITCLLPSTI